MTNNERFPFNDIHTTVVIEEGVQIGKGNTIGPYCVIGFPPEWKGNEHNRGRVKIGDNNRITGHVTIDSGANLDTIIKDNCYLMKHSHVGHDAIINDNVVISCGAKVGGHTVIEKDCNIGLNAVIHQKQKIAEGCMIGMAAVITKKTVTEKNSKYAGNPAKLIGSNDYPTYTHNMKETL